MGLDTGYNKTYGGCPRCGAVHEDCFIREDGCPSCRLKNGEALDRERQRLVEDRRAAQQRVAEQRRKTQRLDAYYQAAKNPYLRLAPNLDPRDDPRCERCQDLTRPCGPRCDNYRRMHRD